MKQYLEAFLKDFEYPQDCAEHLLSCYGAISQDKARNDALQAALTAYDQKCDISYTELEDHIKSVYENFEYHEYTVWLLLYILMSKRLLARYRERGISDDIWKESMCDLKYKEEECWLVKGIHGTFVADWFPRFFHLRCFALGRLEFEITRFWEDTFVCKNGVVIANKARVLGVHIPRSGAPFSKEACDESYRRAAEFFANEFTGEYVIFTCGSWLLYPKNSEFLHERSNARRFGEEYEIVTSSDCEGEDPNIWRIFDVEFTGDLSALPEDTHLRRAYKQRLMSGGTTGKAYGVKLLPKSTLKNNN